MERKALALQQCKAKLASVKQELQCTHDECKTESSSEMDKPNELIEQTECTECDGHHFVAEGLFGDTLEVELIAPKDEEEGNDLVITTSGDFSSASVMLHEVTGEELAEFAAVLIQMAEKLGYDIDAEVELGDYEDADEDTDKDD